METEKATRRGMMPPFNLIDVEQAEPELKSTLEKLGMSIGELPNFIRLLANSPSVLKAFVFWERSIEEGRLTPGEREKIALAVAEINGASYSLSAHSMLGRQVGLTDEEISLARQAKARDRKTQSLLQFTQLLVLQRGDISEEDLSAVAKAGFSQSEIIEIVANVGVNIFSNYLNNLARTDEDFAI